MKLKLQQLNKTSKQNVFLWFGAEQVVDSVLKKMLFFLKLYDNSLYDHYKRHWHIVFTLSFDTLSL